MSSTVTPNERGWISTSVLVLSALSRRCRGLLGLEGWVESLSDMAGRRTWAGGRVKKGWGGGYYITILLIYLLAPRRQGWVGVGGFGRIMARKDFYMGAKGWSAKATGDARRWTIEGMEGGGQTIELNAGRRER